MPMVNLQVKKKINKPDTDGTAGQILKTNGNGSTSWIDNIQIDDAAGVGITNKVWSADKIIDAINTYGETIPVDFGVVSSLPKTIRNNLVTETMCVSHYYASNPDAFVYDPSISISNGSVTISGSLVSGESTALILYLSKQTSFGVGPVKIDDTLSIEGAGADAKKTGEMLDGKAPAIIDIEEDYVHANADSVVVQGNSLAFGDVRYANKKNLIVNPSSGSSTSGSMTITKNRNIVKIDGTASSVADIAFCAIEVDMPAGYYTFKVEPYVGESVLANGKKFHLDIWYDENTSTTYDQRITLNNVKDVPVYSTFTTSSHVYKIRAWFGYTTNVYSDYRIFYSLFPSDVTIVDTEETVSSTGTLNIDFQNSMTVVDTMMHSSNVYTVIDTKTYIDNKTPEIDFVYFRPEDYGAKGDGTTDDSTALQACITAAQTYTSDKGKAIRGFGTYKLATGVVFNCRELDVYLHKIVYTGNDAALIISGSHSKFKFQSIRAINGGSSAVGIRCYQSDNSGYLTTYFNNVLECDFIRANGNAIEMVRGNAVTSSTMMYNTFRLPYIRSDNANAIEIDSPLVTENDFYGKNVSAVSGFLFHFTSRGDGLIRAFNFSLESQLANGTNGGVLFYYCRFAEMTNLQTPLDRTKGRIFAWDRLPGGIVKYPSGGVDLISVDVTNAPSFEDQLSEIKSRYENGATGGNPWWQCLPCCSTEYPRFPVIDTINRAANASFGPNGGMVSMPTGKMIVYYNNIAYKPNEDIYYKVSNDMTVELTSTNNYMYITPTIFDIDAASVTITLDPSYCCLAIDKFDVIQHENKEAIVIDKLGNTIFDGTGLGAGVFHFKCSMVPYGYQELYITQDNGTVRYCPESLARSIYSGENEQWIITREDDTLTELLNKYNKFFNYSEKDSYVENISNYDFSGTVKVYGTESSFGNAKIRNELNIMTTDDGFGNISGLTWNRHGSSFVFNGTKAATTQATYPVLIEKNVEIEADTNLTVMMEASSAVKALTTCAYLTYYAYDNTQTYSYFTPGSTTTTWSTSYTPSKKITKIRLTFEVPAAESTFSDMKFWVGLFPSSVSTIDTELVIQDGSSQDYTSATISSWDKIDFGCYDGSFKYKVNNLKQYIDSVSPDISMTYITPEEFGATGLGVVDDYSALQQCIDYAITNKVSMKAYGTYATSQTLVVDGSNASIEIHRLRPSFNGYAIKVAGMRNRITINDIYNNTGGGGLLVQPITTNNIENNDFVIGRIHVNNGDAIHMECLDDGIQSIIYNTFHINELFSCYGNCIYCENGWGENKWYGGKLSTNAGWGIYMKKHMFNKMYGFSMEADCYAGIYLDGSSHNSFIGFRDIELIMHKEDNTDRGTLIKFVNGSCRASNYYQTSDSIYGKCIDIAEERTIKSYDTWGIVNTGSQSVIETPDGIIQGDQETYSGAETLDNPRRTTSKLIVKQERIICVPLITTAITLGSDLDMSAHPFEGHYNRIKLTGNATIKLSPSYSSAGVNSFVINNPTGASFSVSDCNGVPLVSGSGTGEYKLYCYAELDNVYRGVLGDDVPGWWNGENDVWFVEHEGTVLSEVHLQPFYCETSDTVSLTGELVSSGTWATSDSNVATVSNGTVTAAGEGVAFISLTDNGQAERWVVQVNASSNQA